MMTQSLFFPHDGSAGKLLYQVSNEEFSMEWFSIELIKLRAIESRCKSSGWLRFGGSIRLTYYGILLYSVSVKLG